ncbi:MAG: carboxymuconolactone decarboxylase family protein [Candidatus Tectomicrobia bacterium]|nr:carboxymuconolactone decarboxylase family protein [Candidatus Tectomicrobia bacterium]
MSEAQSFAEQYPQIHTAMLQMQKQCAAWGPLDERTRALIELVIASVRMQPSGVRAQAARALKQGITAEEVRHAILLTLGGCGYSSVMASLAAANEVLNGTPLR